jgi:conjugal transfer pilus assembly protein TraW
MGPFLSVLCLVLALTFAYQDVYARDLGKHGSTFEIFEPNMLIYIQDHLKRMEASGELAKKQQAMKERTKEYAASPTPVSSIGNTTKARKWHIDPTYTVPEDIIDHHGHILHAAGTQVNPLATQALPSPLIFINGDCEGQMEWAQGLTKTLSPAPKIVLTSGPITELMKNYQLRLYFDQQGILSKRLHVTEVPALITQEELKLKGEAFVVPCHQGDK